MLVERQDVLVMFKRAPDELDAIERGMAEVEEAVGLRGRKYYGAFDTDGDEYRVCHSCHLVPLSVREQPKESGLALVAGA